jgi:hypothetical protein
MSTTQSKPRVPEGVTARHSRGCPSRRGEDCPGPRGGCTIVYEARVYDRRAGKQKSKTYKTAAAARSGRASMLNAKANGQLTTTSRERLRDYALRWIEEAEARYKPSTWRGYEFGLRTILPRIGNLRLGEVRRGDLQRLVDELRAVALDGERRLHAHARRIADEPVRRC